MQCSRNQESLAFRHVECQDIEFIEAVKKNTRNLLEMGIHIDLVYQTMERLLPGIKKDELMSLVLVK